MPELVCAMIRTMVSRHQYGSPIPEDALIRFSAIPSHDEGQAHDAYDELRKLSVIEDYGPTWVQLDSSSFGELAEFLYHECGWEEFDLRTRLKHFEGWDEVDLG